MDEDRGGVYPVPTVSDYSKPHSRDQSRDHLLKGPDAAIGNSVIEQASRGYQAPGHGWFQGQVHGQVQDLDPDRIEPIPDRRSQYSDSAYSVLPKDGVNANVNDDSHQDLIDPIPPEPHGAQVPLRHVSGEQYQDREGYHPVQQHPQLWCPFWLRQPVLLAFFVLFAALLAVLLVLWHYSTTHNGFDVAKSTSHYTWTYGPTAVLVIIVGLWRQVDYHCKALVPWAQLRKGPSDASRNLLLDYISPLQLVSLYEAVTKTHVPVIATISGFIILKVLTIFSTALFVLFPTLMIDSNFSLTTTTKFDASSFDPSANLDSFSSAPVYAYYGHIAHGLPLAKGVSTELAFSIFEPAGVVPANAAVVGEVDAFAPQFDCSVVDVKLDGPATVHGSNDSNVFGQISLTGPNGDICQRWPSISVPAQDPNHFICPSRQLMGTTKEIYCDTAQTDVSKGPDIYLYMLTDVRYNQSLFANATQFQGGRFVIASDTSRTVEQVVSVACRPSYAIMRVNLTNNETSSTNLSTTVTTSASQSAANRTLDGFSAWNLTNVFQAAVSSASYLFADKGRVVSSDPQVSNTLFRLMAVSQGTEDYEVLLNGQNLKDAAEMTFKGIASQYAHQSLTVPAQEETTGVMSYHKPRLHLRSVSLWAVVAGFGFLMGMTTVVFFFGPGAVVPRDPNLVGTQATVLARSHDLNRLLRNQGAVQGPAQELNLVGYRFSTAIVPREAGQPTFRIALHEGETPEYVADDDFDMSFRWWQPLFLSLPVKLLTVVLAAGTVAALEVLQRVSIRNHGLYSMPTGQYSEASIHLIPALAMVLLATLFNSLDFSICLFAPFGALVSGNATNRRSIMSNALGELPPSAFLRSLRRRHFGAALSSIAAIFASALIVVVSGLYTVQYVNFTGFSKPLTRVDTFALLWPNSLNDDGGAAGILSLIEHQNLSYPDFTYSEYALPRFSIGNFTTSVDARSSVSGPTFASIPGLRANLDCKILPKSTFNISTLAVGPMNAYGVDEAFVQVQADLPSSCQLGGYLGNQSYFTYKNSFALPAGGKGTYAGAQLDLLFGANASIFGNYGEARGSLIGDSPSVGCPSLAFTFGWFELNSEDKSKVTTMVCYQKMQEVSLNVTFEGDSTQINASQPPVPDESTVRSLLNPNNTTADGEQIFEFRIQNNLNNELETFSGVSNGTTDKKSTSTMDAFFQALTRGVDKVPPEQLVGADNEHRLLDATNHLYRKYMAQVISTKMRRSCDTGSGTCDDAIDKRDADSLSDLSVVITTRRLLQVRPSEMVLMILLGLATIFGGLACWVAKTSHVLPCNPCAIAGAMSLLAGSDLCYSRSTGVCECCGRPRRRGSGSDSDDPVREPMIPEGAEWMTDSQLSSLVFGGHRYSMGWWSEKPGRPRRYGVDVGLRADGLDDQDWELGERGRRHGGSGDEDGSWAAFQAQSGQWPGPAPAPGGGLGQHDQLLRRQRQQQQQEQEQIPHPQGLGIRI